jgi:hypothetical protein
MGGARDVSGSRVLEARLEIAFPSAGATATWREHEVLCATPGTRLEIIQRRSARR